MSNFAKKFLTKQFLIKFSIGFVGFLLFIFLMDSIVMPLYTKHGQEYELPDVTEKPVEEAIEILKTGDFEPVIQDSVFDYHFPPGTVVRQNPLPFATVKKGRRVYLVISKGEKPIQMPNLIGKTPQDAKFILKDNQLELNEIVYEFSEFYPKGVVVNQSIPPGNEVSRGQKVNLTVSLGPAPSSQKMPELKGKSLTTAKKILEAIGVPLRRVVYDLRPNLVPETVLSQSVAPGTPLSEVKYVDLTVSIDRPIEENQDSNQ